MRRAIFSLTLVLCLETAPASSFEPTSPDNEVAKSHPRLSGSVSTNASPFAVDGSVATVPQGTDVSLTLSANVNSELSKVGDQVFAMVSLDVKQGKKVLLPGQWYVRGKVSDVGKQKRLGRDGFVTIKFDRLISPDGKYQIPFDATATTKDSPIKTVAKEVAIDSKYVGKGAVNGAICSVQLTGIPLAVASHGYSVAGGAAIGAAIGLYGALARKGNITSVVPGDELTFKIDKPIVLPAFNADALPSAEPPARLANFDVIISKAQFRRDPLGDRLSSLLDLDFKLYNRTAKEFSLGNFVVVSDRNQMYYPYALSDHRTVGLVRPNTCEQANLTFAVGSARYKYWLVLLDKGNGAELTRLHIN